MKQKYEGKDVQGLVDLGHEQGYLTFEQVNDFLPQDVASPNDLRAMLESFEDMDIKVLEEVPTEGAEGEIEAEPEKEPEEEATDTGDSSDPVRLYLKEMGTFSCSHASKRSKSPSGSRPANRRSKKKSSSRRSRWTFSSIWANESRPARPTCATSSRRAKSPPTPTRSADPKPTKSCSRSCTTPRAS
jgi:Sigma-70 factor, region 1.1